MQDAGARQRPAAAPLTEDEEFFTENDKTAEEELLEDLVFEREALDEQTRLAETTPEWQDYEREVTRVTDALEHDWLTDPSSITKETSTEARRRWVEEVERVQDAHQKRNEARIEAYKQYRVAISSGAAPANTRLPVSPEYAELLDKYS